MFKAKNWRSGKFNPEHLLDLVLLIQATSGTKVKLIKETKQDGYILIDGKCFLDQGNHELFELWPPDPDLQLD